MLYWRTLHFHDLELKIMENVQNIFNTWLHICYKEQAISEEIYNILRHKLENES